MKIVVLCGGKGTRLFPLSRDNCPKQFIKLWDNYSLFQKTVKLSLRIVPLKDIIFITNESYRFILEDQLSELSISIKDANVVYEPEGKNTAPAIALALKFALEELKVPLSEVFFVLPSDHLLSPEEQFSTLLLEAQQLAERGEMITFGVIPSRIETGYGYIEVEPVQDSRNIYLKLKKFHEKPDFKTAQTYIERGNFFWNSGIFGFSLKTILELFNKYLPEIYKMLKEESMESMIENFIQLPNISIDYAIMEQLSEGVVIPLKDIRWADLGCWDSCYEVMDKDDNGNARKGKVISFNSRDSLILNMNSSDKLIVVSEIDELVVIDTDDVLLVTRRGRSQSTRDIVRILGSEEDLRNLVKYCPIEHRPWGFFKNLEKGERYRIKKLMVKPGESLSLQLHYHRSEHWIVAKGTAKVLVEEKGKLREYLVRENESIYIPKATRHKLINPGKIMLEVIEIQIGEYVEEDDIVRFEDKYLRIKTQKEGTVE